MKSLKIIAAMFAAFVLSVSGASAAQHQDQSAPKLSVPAVVAPIGAITKSTAGERIVVAQGRRGGARRGGGARRVGPGRVSPGRRGGGRVVRRRGGRGVAAGAAAAIIGLGVAAAIANQSQASEGGYSCRRLRFRCDDGERWACRRFYRDC